MNNAATIAKVEKFFAKEYYLKYKDILIFQNDDGSYELFDKYHISKEINGYKVVSNSIEKIFASLKNAVTWCVFDSRNKMHQSKRIEYLDKMLAGTEVNIMVHKNLIKKTSDLENKLIYVSKLSQEQVRKKEMLEELDEFIVQSKTWQTSKFATK